MSYKRGLSISEVIVVLAIVLTLAAILIPVAAAAKDRSAQATCLSNLRQLGSALELYLSESEGLYPLQVFGGKKIKALAPIVHSGSQNSTGLLRCPKDAPNGRSGRPQDSKWEPTTYYNTWLFWNGESGLEAWKELVATEPNPIVLHCYFHDDQLRPMLLSQRSEDGFGLNGKSQHLRKDGSEKFIRRKEMGRVLVDSDGNSFIDAKESYWLTATDLPCPKSVCDGKPSLPSD